jgi:UDP-N-acetylglucosamine 2-epimerase (non-hydrolysing)
MPRPNPTTVLFLIGTRPELIKLAPVLWACEHEDTGVVPVVCFTGQHRELVDELAPLLGVVPDFQLGVMRPGQDLAGLSSRLLTAIDVVLESVRPSVVVGQGDTTTVLMGALASFYRRIPFVHVEAGLRTADQTTPFPEEANRRLVATLAGWHFAPTDNAAAHLLGEGICPSRIRVVGNTVVDAVKTVAATMPPSPVSSTGRRRIVLTMHRRESFGTGLASVAAAVRVLAERFPDVDIVWPVHPNPVVQKVAEGLSSLKNLQCLSPLNYPDMVALISSATLLLTDSGGLQEEGPSLGVPVLVLRDETERPEGIETGVARLVGTNTEQIVTAVTHLLTNDRAREEMINSTNPYGDGQAGKRIAAALPAIGQTGWSFIEAPMAPANSEQPRRPMTSVSMAGSLL